MVNNLKKSQAEIFGIALLFVVIILGIIIYMQFSSIKNETQEDLQKEGEYKILAEGTLNTLLKMSTGCKQSVKDDSLKDLINFCIENYYSGQDPKIQCNDLGESKFACTYVKEKINQTLYQVFNETNTSGKFFMIPFELKMRLPSDSYTPISNITITNFGEYKYKGTIINQSNRKKFGFKKAPSGFFTFATAKRNIEFELYLYYR